MGLISGTASHGAWCGARTYPTRCRHCHEKVFYFECNCGCKVFFSELGNGWPEHRCLGLLVKTYGKDFIEKGMAAQMMKHPASNIATRIERRLVEAVLAHDKQRKSGDSWITKVEPKPGDAIAATAVIREVLPEIDVYSKLGMPRGSAVCTGFLGKLGKEKVGQVTVHIGDLSHPKVRSYTGIVAADTIARLKLQQRDLVIVRLEAIVVVGKCLGWLFAHIAFLDEQPQG